MSGRRRRGAGPKRGPRETKYAKILWNDCPRPCADVIHVKKILVGNFTKGTIVPVSFSKDVVKHGTVLELGSERSLKKIHVDEQGQPCNGIGIPCRRECELRQKISFRRGVVQSEADQELLQNVERSNCLSGGLPSRPLPPLSKVDLLERVAALPAVPTPEQVQDLLSRLPCLRAGSSVDIALISGIDIFINGHVLATYHRHFQHVPGRYMSSILTELIPPEVLCLPYITAKGKGPTKIGLPEDLFKAVTVYIDHRTKGYAPVNGWANAINGIINHLRQQRQQQQTQLPAPIPPNPVLLAGPSTSTSLTVTVTNTEAEDTVDEPEEQQFHNLFTATQEVLNGA